MAAAPVGFAQVQALLVRRALAAVVLLSLATAAAQAGFRPEGVDPYEVLGIKRGGDTSGAALKRAYRQAALRWHPDKVPADQKEEAEQRFIAIAWAFEVLSDPQRRGLYDRPPPPRSGPGAAAGEGPHGGEQQQRPPQPGGPERDFDMDAAARVFRDVFGNTSEEYQHLIRHLMDSSGAGDQEHWRKHAESIKAALGRKGKGGSIDIETVAADGSGRIRTKHSTTSDGKGTTTRKTTTEHTRTTVHGSGPGLPGGAHAASLDAHAAHLAGHDAHAAHMAAHEAAVKAAEAAHRKAFAAAGHALPGRGSEL